MYYNVHTHRRLPADGGVYSIINIDSLDAPFCLEDGELQKYSAGIHPWRANVTNLPDTMMQLKQIVESPRVLLVGECGLDKRCDTSFEVQQQVLDAQIQLSEEVQKPMIIHCVKAWEEIVSLKKRHQPKQAWIIHGFRGKPQLMQQLIGAGFYLSFGRLFNEESIQQTPIGRLLLETDENDECSIQAVYRSVANSRNIKEADLVSYVKDTIRNVVNVCDVK